MKKSLMKIGLSENESEIYISLLKIGECSVNSIVKATGINRTNIYDCISRLVEKGLVSSIIKNGKKNFSATNPKRIIDYLNEKEKQIKDEKEEVTKIIPEIESIIPKVNNEKIEVFDGKNGIRNLLELILESEKNICSYGSSGNEGNMSILGPYFNHYVKRMSKTKIKARIIFADKERKPFKYNFGEVKYLPREYATTTETMIYGDNVVIFVFGDEPKAIHINSKTVANSYLKHFELMWKIAKKF
ncbi:hypothetical protein FJZ21_02295 [Candidatus Pacearchaeota archaeon]|nr:hypothetical protein [Candidatus Pacearchaeota archaeon]